MTANDIPARITELLEERGWSRYELHKKCGVPRTTFYSVFTDDANPGIDVIEKICSGLGISLGNFFSPGADFGQTVEYTTEEKELITIQRRLYSDQRAAVRGYAQALVDANEKKDSKKNKAGNKKTPLV